MPVCVKKERNGPASVDQGLSTIVAQNLSSKRIAQTDNMRPKTPKKRHRFNRRASELFTHN